MERRAKGRVVARAPAGTREDEEEAGEDERRLDQPEEDPGAVQQRALDHAFGARPWRPLHEAGLSRLAAESERREDLRAEVDREDLQHRQRQRDRAAREREDQEGNELGRGVREDVEDELPDVVVDPSAGGDRRHDGREVVVREHHRRRLTRDVGSRDSHGDADVRASERGRVVDAVAGHRHHVPLRAERVGDPQLRLRRGAREARAPRPPAGAGRARPRSCPRARPP